MSPPFPDALRLAVISLHTCPLAQPGRGDAGGMNVYVLQTARELAARGHEVEILTRRRLPTDADVVDVAERLRLRHLDAGPRDATKDELPAVVAEFAAAADAATGPIDAIHSHYWLSGLAGLELARARGAAHVTTFHTLAAVKDATRSPADRPEPQARLAGERTVAAGVDRVLTNTATEAEQVHRHLGVATARLDVVAPGVDLATFHPDTMRPSRRALARLVTGAHAGSAIALDPGEEVLAFVGRLQPLKGPDVAVRTFAALAGARPLARLVIAGAASGTAGWSATDLAHLADDLGVGERVSLLGALAPEDLADLYRAADLVLVPSRSESFGLVALEAQACGTPVVATRVGGLVTAVADQISGVLVDGFEPSDWARAVTELLDSPDRLTSLAQQAPSHAARFSWSATAGGVETSLTAAAARAAARG